MQIRFLAPLLLTAAIACSPASQPAAAPSPAPTTVTAIRIGGPSTDAAVVGTAVALIAVGQLRDGGEIALRNVVWTSSSDNIARIDTAGVLTPLTHGTVVVRARSGDVSGELTLDVVPGFAGAWSVTYASASPCSHASACPDGPVDGRFVITQAGRRVDGEWTDGGLYGLWSGRLYSGVARVDGTLELSASRCSINDIDRGRLFRIRDWLMHPEGDGSFVGAFIWEEHAGNEFRGHCNGVPSVSNVLPFRVTRFRRQ